MFVLKSHTAIQVYGNIGCRWFTWIIEIRCAQLVFDRNSSIMTAPWTVYKNSSEFVNLLFAVLLRHLIVECGFFWIPTRQNAKIFVLLYLKNCHFHMSRQRNYVGDDTKLMVYFCRCFSWHWRVGYLILWHLHGFSGAKYDFNNSQRLWNFLCPSWVRFYCVLFVLFQARCFFFFFLFLIQLFLLWWAGLSAEIKSYCISWECFTLERARNN